MTDHSLEATPPSEDIRNAEQIVATAGSPGRVNPETRMYSSKDVAAILRLLASARVRAQTLETEVAQMRGLAANYAKAPCFSALLGELDEENPCTCPTCGHRAILAVESVSPQRRDETPA